MAKIDILGLDLLPIGWRLVAEPGVLALGIVAGCLCTALKQFFSRNLTCQEGADFRYPNGPHDGQGRVKLASEQDLDLGNCPLLKHAAKPPVAALVKPGSVR